MARKSIRKSFHKKSIPHNQKLRFLVPAECVHCPWLMAYFWAENGGNLKKMPVGLVVVFQNYKDSNKKKHQTPPSPSLWHFWMEKGDNFKSWPTIPKLRIWLLMGWGRSLKMTLQTRALENFRSCWWGSEQSVARVQTRARLSYIKVVFHLFKTSAIVLRFTWVDLQML